MCIFSDVVWLDYFSSLLGHGSPYCCLDIVNLRQGKFLKRQGVRHRYICTRDALEMCSVIMLGTCLCVYECMAARSVFVALYNRKYEQGVVFLSVCNHFLSYLHGRVQVVKGLALH